MTDALFDLGILFFATILLVGSYLNYRRTSHPTPHLRTVPNEDLEKTKGGPVETPRKYW